MKLLLALLFVTLFPLVASAIETSEACAADTWKNEGTLNEMFSEPWPPGVDSLMALGCIPEGELLKRFFGATFEETRPRKFVCDNGWHTVSHRIDGREERVHVRIYKDEKVVGGVYSPNFTSMSPILYVYVYVGPDKVKVMQVRAFEAALLSKFDTAPNQCVEEEG